MKLKLRGIKGQPAIESGQRGIILSDPLGVSQKMLFIPESLVLLLALMDGTRDIGALRTGFELRTGTALSSSVVEQFVSQLDDVMFLENERFTRAYEVAIGDYRSAASRPPVLAGKCYPPDAAELGDYLHQYIEQLGDVSLECPSDVKGLISPHIDFERGGRVYAEVWARVREAVKQAELVVILGTDHNEGEGKVTFTRQNYETPWGILPTAHEVVDEFGSEIGEGIFECELNHRGEHSIETAIIWLHHLLGDKPCHVLPILCGSFQPFIERGESPLSAPHIASTVEVLKKVISSRRAIIVAAADLAHVGPVFGDSVPVDITRRARMAEQDGRLIDIMSCGQAEDFFAEISNDGDRRRVCGVPPIYIALSTLSGATGVSVGYAQCPASDDGTSLVSICGMLY